MQSTTVTTLAAILMTLGAAACGDDGDGTSRSNNSIIDAQRECVRLAAEICSRRIECTESYTMERIASQAADALLERCIEGMANGPLDCGAAEDISRNFDDCVDEVVDARCVYTRESGKTSVDIAVPPICEGVILSQ